MTQPAETLPIAPIQPIDPNRIVEHESPTALILATGFVLYLVINAITQLLQVISTPKKPD
ncbi:hypothetical protein [Spirulina subsalsa]|uniref:hypothetical protein n=1 Tax=Spirulina subsalsa TaxID=54311 RepID=UPI0002D9E21C|nr:hypothetical protein [Spirulina subsalsa]